MEKQFKNTCCSLDLETDNNGNIFALGAVFNNQRFQRHAPFSIVKVLQELDDFAEAADYILGHNVLAHDLVICKSIAPTLRFLQKPVIDTLLLSPLAFPENPYHHLVKDYKLVRSSVNDPLADARLALTLFSEQWEALQQQHSKYGNLSFYHYVFSEYRGLQALFLAIGAESINGLKAFDSFKQLTQKRVCNAAFVDVVLRYLPDATERVALAYCLAWLLVAGGNSVLPRWVRQRFDHVAPILSQLRDIPCGKPECEYCATMHNPVDQLQRYFGFSKFREQPATEQGDSLQQAIVQAAMANKPVFAILPTGGGKSLCFQLPALVRYQRRGVLTIVISPLQALMKDQVDNLRTKTGAPHAAALNGMLTAPERGAVLNAVQKGDTAILYISPEQLRNPSFQKAIEQREIGCWVFDEAHCLSKWGHDFRADYLYAARFIKEFAQKQNALLPPVQCFTATAKQDVKIEIIDYFRAHLGQELTLFEGGVDRDNLSFEVRRINKAEKHASISRLLTERINNTDGSAIIYCSTQKRTEEVADYLQAQDFAVEAFHAGKNVAEKKHIQENFISGTTRIITATNAFGMGIDKDNVRLVIHADIPGSLENYLQEAGRAGRDQQDAECILLFDDPDIETQFKLSALSQVRANDIKQILRALRFGKKDSQGNIVITTGELMQSEQADLSFNREESNADTKVKTAISWLERANFIERNENRTQVFQGRPLVKNLEDAKQKIAKLDLSKRLEQRWLAILEMIMNADIDEGFSADTLAELIEFEPDEKEQAKSKQTASQRVIRTLYDMAAAGLIQKSLLLSAYIRYKVANSSIAKLEKLCHLEVKLLALLQEQAPDADFENWQVLSLRHLNQCLLDAGYIDSNPDVLRGLLASLAEDGRGLAGKEGSISLRYQGIDCYKIKLNRPWQALIITAERRQNLSLFILNSLLARVPQGTASSAELLVEFAAEDLLADLKTDLVIMTEIKDPLAAIERALNFLHEQRVITLQKGLAVFRQAMTIQVLADAKSRRYTKGDYEPLAQHYNERVFQIHVINEYARLALEKLTQAQHFVLTYFSEDKAEFVKRYFADRKAILEQATSEQSFQRIVGDLHNPEQSSLVASGEDDNLLILAGPGSGKTHVVVHRVAYLLLVKRMPARGILVVCFNRSAVTELRRRLINLVGDDGKGVTIQTYHGLSLRLTGRAINRNDAHSEDAFKKLITEATRLLTGETRLLGFEGDDMRERLLAGYRYILVDEYQDIDEQQYQLISAIAGRTLDEDNKLTLLAVGDDDQNIYSFRGANIGFIRQFKEDYQAREFYLVENYRSSTHIIAAANALIAHNQDRMKQCHPIRINQGRKILDAGGRWQKLDPVARGRVQIIHCQNEATQALAIVNELLRLKQLDAQMNWSQCVVVATQWQFLTAIRLLLEAKNIPISLSLDKKSQPPLFKIREIAHFLTALKQEANKLHTASHWLACLTTQYSVNPWVELLREILQDWQKETNDSEVSTQQTLEFLYENLMEQRREQRLGKGVLLTTVHSVKGMEFAHVLIADGAWQNAEPEIQRRLLYVAMTRAKETLSLMQRLDDANPFLQEISGDFCLQRKAEFNDEQASLVSKKAYCLLGLQDVDISYASRRVASHAIHSQLKTLAYGSLLTLAQENEHIFLKQGDSIVGKLSAKARQQWQDKLTQIISIKVIAIINWRREDCEENYRAACKVELWEVPIVELFYHL